MSITRRNLLKNARTIPIGALAITHANALAAAVPPTLPDKASFEAMDGSYMDSGSQHPISLQSSLAVEKYLAKRRLHPNAAKGRHDSVLPLSKFAQLINADVDEVAYVQSTTAGEQMILRALGFPHIGGHIVTDTLHFPGSLPTYEGMSRMGVDVTWVQERDGRTHLEDIKKAIRSDTKLIALSLVSNKNGFQHDLKAVCDLAHENGALVYADIIHAAGCIPVDVKQTGVDFAACASYKWLMGDFGLGFVYVRKDLLSQLTPTNFGYFGLNTPQNSPQSTNGGGFTKSASEYFALGTRSFTTVAILENSLEYILTLGVDNIQNHTQKLTDRLKEELPALGYPLSTPLDSKTPIVSCIFDDAAKILSPRLDQARVKISVYNDHFRISPSVFNDMTDVDRLLSALKI